MTRFINLRAWEVRAILAGRKTRVRRVLKVQPEGADHFPLISQAGDEFKWMSAIGCGAAVAMSGWINLSFSPGDVIPGRETWMPETEQGIPTGGIIYHATDNPEPDGDVPLRWCSPILMPSWAVRIKLRVKAVRVERVQEISEADARAEGIRFFDFGVVADPNFADGRPVKGWSWKHDAGPGDLLATARLGYANAYINDHGPGSWERNEWVAVGEIELVSDRKEKEEGG